MKAKERQKGRSANTPPEVVWAGVLVRVGLEFIASLVYRGVPAWLFVRIVRTCVRRCSRERRRRVRSLHSVLSRLTGMACDQSGSLALSVMVQVRV